MDFKRNRLSRVGWLILIVLLAKALESDMKKA